MGTPPEPDPAEYTTRLKVAHEIINETIEYAEKHGDSLPSYPDESIALGQVRDDLDEIIGSVEERTSDGEYNLSDRIETLIDMQKVD